MFFRKYRSKKIKRALSLLSLHWISPASHWTFYLLSNSLKGTYTSKFFGTSIMLSKISIDFFWCSSLTDIFNQMQTINPAFRRTYNSKGLSGFLFVWGLFGMLVFYLSLRESLLVGALPVFASHWDLQLFKIKKGGVDPLMQSIRLYLWFDIFVPFVRQPANQFSSFVWGYVKFAIILRIISSAHCNVYWIFTFRRVRITSNKLALESAAGLWARLVPSKTRYPVLTPFPWHHLISLQ